MIPVRKWTFLAGESISRDCGLSPRTLIVLFVFALALRLGCLAIVWNGPLGNADSAPVSRGTSYHFFLIEEREDVSGVR